jgi:hypothetical protein
MTYPSDPMQSGIGVAAEQQYGQAPVNGKMNPLAVAGLVFGLTGCLSLLGIVFGITALRQIGQDGGRGRGLAIAGIVLGAIANGTAAILIIISFAAS